MFHFYKEKQNIMQQTSSQIFSQRNIDLLFSSSYFIDKFQELQIQTNNDLAHVQQMIKVRNNDLISNQTSNLTNCKEDVKKDLTQKQRSCKPIECGEVVNEITQLILHNFRENVLKQTNLIYENKLNIISIMEQIQNIKLNLSKIGQASSFVTTGKTATTHESIAAYQNNKKVYKEQSKQPNEVNTSMFIGMDEESSIQIGSSRKKLADDKINSFSFMNSFLNDNKFFAQDEEIINQRINASISKIQSSIDDRISQLQKQFNRRIQQILKTVQNLIQMIHQNDRISYQNQNPFQKSIKKAESINVQQICKKNNIKSTINSKSSINMPLVIKKSEHDETRNTGRQHIKTEPFDAQTYYPSKIEKNIIGKPLQSQGILNKSSNKLASFFGLAKPTNSIK